MDDLEVAREAARAGAAEVRARFRGQLQQLDKGGGDLATDADLASEAAIVALLRTRRPDDEIVAEESGRHGGTSGRTWFVDPLCGTLNFAAGTGPIAVNVALRDGDDDVAAAVADPLSGDLWWAAGDRSGARRDGVDRALVPSVVTRLVDLDLDAPTGPAPAWELALLADPSFRAAFRARVASSSAALAWVAAGHRRAYLTSHSVVDSVHFAAGITLCRAAGCVVTDLTGGPVESGLGLVAAADAGTGRRLVDLVQAHR